MFIVTSKTDHLLRHSIADLSEQDPYGADISAPITPAVYEGQVPSATGAAVALAQLHNWDSDYVSQIQHAFLTENSS